MTASGCACGGGPHEPYVPEGPRLLYLCRDDLDSPGIGMEEIIAALDGGCAARGRGEVEMPARLTLHGDGGAFSQGMPASLPTVGGLGVKWVTIFPASAGLRAVRSPRGRRAGSRPRAHGDHDECGHPAAARPRAARARGAGGGPRLRRRLELRRHGGVRPLLLRRRAASAGGEGGRRGETERLFCLNLGMALEDVVTARLVLDRARELGVGRELPL